MALSALAAMHPAFWTFTWHISKGPAGGWSSIIGIVVAIIGNILISFALNTQRYAHIKLSREKEEREERAQSDKARNQRAQGYGTSQGLDGAARSRRNTQTSKSDHEESQPLLQRSDRTDSGFTPPQDDQNNDKEKNYLSSPWWWLGISLMIIGECGNFLAYGFAPASIVSPLGVVALVSNCLIAPWMLHEKFRKRDALGVLIATAGCVIVVLSASGSNPKLDADEIWRLISTWEFKTYFGITLFLIIALMYASSRYGEKSILIDLGLVGLFGGYTALSTKGVASLLSNTIWRVVTFPVTYLLVAILVSTAILQIKYVNRALQRFDSTQVIPTQFVLFTLSVIIGSAILYRDFERKAADDAGEFFAGCALTFLGVYCITSGRSKYREADEEEGSTDEEEGIHLNAEDAEEALASPVVADRPPTVRTQSTRSEGPVLRLVTADDGHHSEDLPTDLLVQPWKTGRTFGAISSIHHPPSQMTDNLDSVSPKQVRRPPVHATTSDPVLSLYSEGSNAARRQPSLTSPLLRSATYERPRTPEHQMTPITEPGSAATTRFGSIGRHSIAELLPHMGPLTNPLSNSLSAIVADSLRKGVDFAPSNSARRRSLRSKRSRRLDEAFQFTSRLPEEEGEDRVGQSPIRSSPLRHGRTESVDTPGGQSDTESRSFGQAFGAFFHHHRTKSRSEEDGA